MDKNIIKNHLEKRFLSEDSTPGIDVTKKAQKESGKINKAGVKDMGKEVTAYDKAVKKTDKDSKTMATNKFNYDGDKEKEYHDQMEIMNGLEMIEYDRDPNKEFKDRAEEGIAGSSRMGNNPEWANVVAKGQGGDPEFGKNLVKNIKASFDKRQDAVKGIMSFGDDIETVPKGQKPMGKHSALKEGTEQESKKIEAGYGSEEENDFNNQQRTENPMNENNKPQIKETTEKNTALITKWINEMGSRETAIKLINVMLNKAIGMSSDDLTDSATFANGIDAVEEMLNDNDFGGALDTAKETVRDMLEDEGYPMFENNNKPENKNNNNKPQIKEGMKRLKFKKEFNGVGNALKMIPEGYKVNDKVFEMTDGNESYKVRWEGTLSEGRAIVLTAADKNMVNEDMQKMKHLMGYKSQATLGLVKGNARINENNMFNDIYAKTKTLLEGEDIEGQTAPVKKTEEKLSHAKEAKKDIEGSTSDDKSQVAPKPKKGEWEDISVPQASDAKKHVEGSVDTKIGMGLGEQADGEGEWDQIDVPQGAAHGNPSKSTYNPSAGTGEWDKISVPQATDAKKHVSMNEDKKKSKVGIQLGENYFEEMETPYEDEEEMDYSGYATMEEEVVYEEVNDDLAREFFITRFQRQPEHDQNYFETWKERLNSSNPEAQMDDASIRVWRELSSKNIEPMDNELEEGWGDDNVSTKLQGRIAALETRLAQCTGEESQEF